MADHGRRPAVSVVVPFLGDGADAEALARSLGQLRLGPEDEIIVADNTAVGLFPAETGESRIRTVHAPGERSSYHARNCGAEVASNDWLLFMDSDTRAVPDIIDRYFAAEPGPRVGAVVGPMLPLRRGTGLMARYAEARPPDKQRHPLSHPFRSYGATGNILVRREAFMEVGGFLERVRSGGDADFGWRLQDYGRWLVMSAPGAIVRHLLRESLRSQLRLHVRYGGGRTWLRRRWPEADLGYGLGRLPRLLARVPANLLRGRFEQAAFAFVDALVVLAEAAGQLIGNEPPAREGAHFRAEIALMVDRFPEPSQTFVWNEARAIAAAGRSVVVEARSRPRRPAFAAVRGLPVRWAEDAGPLRRVADATWLWARHPLRAGADVLARRRWRREEEVSPLRILSPVARRIDRSGVRHLHVHFARRSAMDAIRLKRLLGVPFSVTAHAFDVFLRPQNLEAKLAEAEFVTSGCDYNVSHLAELTGTSGGPRVHRIVMGVDAESFRRSIPYDPAGPIVAVGRLVEKKGFADLIDAVGLLENRQARVVIAGDGPLREALRSRVAESGLAHRLEMPGALSHDAVRQLIESASVLVMPSVVAPDGDRDSMPVVVKEALALEVPVIATDEVGLPEVVLPEWGRLVPPGSPRDLAVAIDGVLALSASTRREMGRVGRRFVAGELSLATQTEKLLDLVDHHRERPPESLAS